MLEDENQSYYILETKEILKKGASLCYVYRGSVKCYVASGGDCYISNNGSVDCSDGNESWLVNSDGSMNNHFAP